MDKRKTNALECHRRWKGKLEITPRAPVGTAEELAVAYTPGVAEPCLEIQKDKDLSYVYTRRHNLIAVVTDGSAVLGLGNIGPEAGMPVMEGKCALFKAYGDVDAFPLCIRSQKTEDIVRTVELLAGSFGGINLEDISAPRCFEVEKALKESLDIPVFHDDQHGTAVVTLAALINALRLTGRKIEEIKLVVNGAGAAAIAVSKLLLHEGLRPENLIMCDSKGTLYKGRENMNPYKSEIAEISNASGIKGSLADALKDADVFIGLSVGGIMSKEMVKSMAAKPIVFACANPEPEIYPDEALAAGAGVVATGRSDFPNQINNVLAFPGIFRGALDCRASEINSDMNIAAAYAIADAVPQDELSPDKIMPNAFDKSVAQRVAEKVKEAARKSGVSRI